MGRARARTDGDSACAPARGAGGRRGYLLFDLLLAVVVISILVAVAVPSLRPNDSLKLVSAATILTSDLEFAQSATLDDPSDATIVRVDEEKARYWLAKASSPQTPIDRPTGGPYEVQFGVGANEHLDGLGLRLENGRDGAVVFDSFGRLDQVEDARVVVTSPSGELAVRVVASTGSVYIGR